MALTGLVAPTIIAALIAGVCFAFVRPARLRIASPQANCAYAVMGVILGAPLAPAALGSLTDDWAPLLTSIVIALGISAGLGLVLERRTPMDAITSMLATVAGGSAGIVAMCRDLGGDSQLVAFSQYLRVFVILLVTPIVASIWFAGGAPTDSGTGTVAIGLDAWLSTFALAAIGWASARAIQLPAATLLGPLLLTAAVKLVGFEDFVGVPPLMRDLAFTIIGFEVGLRFDAATIARVRASLTALASSVAALLLLSLVIAVGLYMTTAMTFADAYLATTPGGLTAVAAAAHGTGANLSLVVGLQSVRTVIAVILAPLTVRLAIRWSKARTERLPTL